MFEFPDTLEQPLSMPIGRAPFHVLTSKDRGKSEGFSPGNKFGGDWRGHARAICGRSGAQGGRPSGTPQETIGLGDQPKNPGKFALDNWVTLLILSAAVQEPSRKAKAGPR